MTDYRSAAEKAKKENTDRMKMFSVTLIHFLITLALFYGTFILFRYREIPRNRVVGYRYNYYVTFGYAFILLFFNRTYNSYLFGYSRIRTLLFSMWLSQFFSVGIIYFVVCIGWNKLRS